MNNRTAGWQFASGEVSGSLGDLGLMLPFVIGFINIAGFEPTGILVGFGLMYLLTAYIYRAPVPVQPMKVMGAAVLVGQLSASEAAAAGLIMGAVLLLLALSGLMERLSNLIPGEVNVGIMAGLGLSLATLGLKYVNTDLILGATGILLTLLLLSNRKLPAALLVLVFGSLAGLLFNPGSSWPELHTGFYLPSFHPPVWASFESGFLIGFLPQFPQTLTNAIIVTAALGAQLFPERSERITERNLMLSLGAGNLLLPLMGGFPCCHGSGGMGAHYRFGGRTGWTPLIIGSLLLLMGILLGPESIDLMAVVPEAILGCLLFYSGIELLLSSRSALQTSRSGFFCIMVTAVLCLVYNAGAGFISGIAIYYLLQRIDPFGESKEGDRAG